MCVGYKLLNSIELVVGIIGIVLFSVGIRCVSSVDVVVGKIPVAWVLGLLSIITGSGCLLLCGTLFIVALTDPKWDKTDETDKTDKTDQNYGLMSLLSAFC